MDDAVFHIRTYGWKELAVLYNPDVLPDSAVRRLRQWVARNPRLSAELEETGWKAGSRLLTPLQVGIIVRHLGEP